jgi:hypothetical protein
MGARPRSSTRMELPMIQSTHRSARLIAGAVSLALGLLGVARVQAADPPAGEARYLVLIAAGKPDQQGAVTSLIHEICQRVASTSVASHYTNVLKIERPLSAEAISELPPDQEKHAAEGIVDHVTTALGQGATPSCLKQPFSFRAIGNAPFEVLILGLTHGNDVLGNVRIKRLYSNGKPGETELLSEADAMGVPLLSSSQARTFAGCVAYAVWRATDWPVRAQGCEEWNLPGAPWPAHQRWSTALTVGGTALLVAGAGVWLVADRKYRSLSRNCTLVQPCPRAEGEPGKSLVKTLDGISAVSAGLGAAALVGGSLVYFLGKRSEENRAVLQAAPGVLSDGVGLVAYGAW